MRNAEWRLPPLNFFISVMSDEIFQFAGVNTLRYTANLGDNSKNEMEKCFCATPDTCLTRNLYDMTKCLGVPIIGSLPHFYDSDEKYLQMVDGLHPTQVTFKILEICKHGYIILIKLRLNAIYNFIMNQS